MTQDPLSMEVSLEAPYRCRACLRFAITALENDEFVNLEDTLNVEQDFDNDGAPTVLNCFNYCTQLDITLDGEPVACHYLCNACKDSVCNAYQFITKARRNETILQQLYKNKLETRLAQSINIEIATELTEDITCEAQQSWAESDLDTKHEGNGLVFSESNVSSSNDSKENALDVFEIDILDEHLDGSDESTKANEKRVRNVTSISVKTDSDVDECEENERKNYFVFNCELCTQKFDFQRALMQHYEIDHDDKYLNFPCESCNGRFVTKNALRIHKRKIHQKCEYLDCEKCGRTVLQSFYQMHQKRHIQKRQFLCSQCPNTYSSKYTLNKHMELHSDERHRNFECKDCKRKFYTLEQLRVHCIVHQKPTERNTYTCTLCSKTFMRQSNLKLHMQMHRGETIDCALCGKKFVRRKDLEIHTRFHTGEYPFACSMCDKRFAIKGHLKYHEKKHLGVRYKCSKCDKEFINLSGLKQHAFDHTGMHPLACTICGRGFPTKFKMRRHLSSVHQKVFKTGYTDLLAEQYIKYRDNATLKENAENDGGDTEHLEMLEILEEHLDDIANSVVNT